MHRISKMVGLCISVLLLLAVVVGCPQPNDDPAPVKVTGVSIMESGNDITDAVYVLWEPSDTSTSHPKVVQLKAEVSPENAADKTVTWSVAPSGIASVSSTGFVMAESEGQVTVSAKAGAITASVDIKVMKAGMELKPVTGVGIFLGTNEQTSTLLRYIGDTVSLGAAVQPEDATIKEIIWESSDEDVASISSEGVITAKQKGKTTITVKTKGLTAEWSPATASFTLDVWPNPGWTPSPGYLNRPLDFGNPVYFYGNKLEYKGQTIPLDDHSIYIDGSFTDAEIANMHAMGLNVYNDFYKVFESRAERKHAWNDAVKTDGTAAKPFNVYFAPWVHWIDDPNDPEVYNTTARGTAVSMQSIPYLRFIGLTDDYRNVVIAADRGQAVGAQGNFTFFTGGGGGNWVFENISICSYANFDLIFPLDSNLPDNFESRNVVGMNPTTKKFSRPMRSEGIGQSQISLSGGANFLAKNCAFWSKHNSSLPSGSQTFYYKCSLEGGQHGMSWSNTTIYYESSVGLWGSQNGGSTGNFAALNCDIYLRGSGSHTFGDGVGTGNAALIDCRIISGTSSRNLGWTKNPPLVYRGYQSGVTYLVDPDSNMVPGDGKGTKLTARTERGSPYTVNFTGFDITDQQYRPDITVDITGKEALKAYKFTSGGQTYYNYINVMGITTFDPLEILPAVQAANLTSVPRAMSISLVATGTGANVQSQPSSGTSIQVGNTTNGGDRKTLSYGTVPSGYEVSWRLAPTNSSQQNNSVKTVGAGDGTPAVAANNFRVLPNNKAAVPYNVLVEAVSDFGLRAAYNIVSYPEPEGVQSFVTEPKIVNLNDGSLKVEYDIGLKAGLNDWSTINWYKSDNADGTGNRTLVWTTRSNISVATSLGWLDYRPPEYIYRVQYNDIGKYITAEVTPRHSNSAAGTALDMISATYSVNNVPTAITQADWRLTIDYPTFDGFPNIRTGPTSGNTLTRNAALNPAKPPAARLVPGVWNADIADPPEQVAIGRNMSNGNWSNASAWAWTTPATNTNDKRPGLLQQAVGSRLYYIPPAKTGGGKYSDMEITWTFGHPKGNTYGGSAPQYFDVLFNFDFEAGTGYAVRLQRTGVGSSGSVAAGIVKYRGWTGDTTDRATIVANHPFGGYTDPIMPRPSAEDAEDSGFIPESGNVKRYAENWWTSTRPAISFRTYYTINIKVVNGKITAKGRSTGSSDNTDFDEYSADSAYNFDFEYTIPAGDTAWLNHPGGFGVWTPGTSGAGAASNDNSLSLRRLKVTWGN